MNWNSPMEVHYQNHAVPYNSIGSFVDFFGGLTSDHVNFISTDAPYAQESSYYAMNTNLYKFAVTELESSSHYESAHGYVVNDHIQGIDEYSRHLENPPVPADDQATAAHVHEEENLSSSSSLECPRNQQNTRDYEVVWEDNIDPDNMSYEELLELGEAVGTQSRGLSEDFIALLPISKFKRGLFSRKKFKGERCVVCQMEYKRGDRQMTLPCKHIYHAACGSRWLSINKGLGRDRDRIVFDRWRSLFRSSITLLEYIYLLVLKGNLLIVNIYPLLKTTPVVYLKKFYIHNLRIVSQTP